jgi:hypothetical protein
MALYGKSTAELHSAAVDAMDSCLSAACVHEPYKLRLEPHKDAILELLGFFEKPETVYEHTQTMRLVVSLFDGEYFTGFQVLRHQDTINRLRKRIKGKLMGTRMILADNDSKPGKAKKNFAKFKLAEEQDG